MEDIVYYSSLYDMYGELLTEKQKLYFEDYYFNNLTLSEIAENYSVSRNAVHKQIKEVLEKLDFYEEKLKMFKRKQKLEQLMNEIKDEKIKELLGEIEKYE